MSYANPLRYEVDQAQGQDQTVTLVIQDPAVRRAVNRVGDQVGNVGWAVRDSVGHLEGTLGADIRGQGDQLAVCLMLGLFLVAAAVMHAGFLVSRALERKRRP
jgi:hypothetical protein